MNRPTFSVKKEDTTLATRMATQLGQLPEFDPATEKIATYLERVKLFFLANETPDKKSVPVFLNGVAGKTYALLRDLVAPSLPAAKTFAELAGVLKEHFEPKPIIVAERFYFHQRSQGPTETIAEYIAELRRLAKSCEYGEFLEESLRDRLVCGVRSHAIQKRLLSESNLKLAHAIQISQSMEAADANGKKLHGDEAVQVHRAFQRHGGRTAAKSAEKVCYRCGGTDHQASLCRFREVECNKCHKKGHLARVCRSSRPANGPTPARVKAQRFSHHPHRSQQSGNTQPTHTIRESTVESDSEDTVLPLFKVGRKALRPIVVTLNAIGRRLPMEVDTGAAVSIISAGTKEELFPDFQLTSTSLILTTYTGEEMEVTGKMQVEVSYGDYKGCLSLYVVEGTGPTLMGRDWLRLIRLDWASIHKAEVDIAPAEGAQLSQLDPPDRAKGTADTLLDKYTAVFQEGPGEMNTFEATLHLKNGARPRFCRARPVPFALKETIERELDRLESSGIIEKVTYSPWAAPVVPVPKGDGHIRLCGDYIQGHHQPGARS